MSSISRNRHLIFVTLFVLATSLPLIETFTKLTPQFTPNENRRLARPPVISGEQFRLKKFPDEFEKYFSDHFGFRPLLVRLSNFISYRFLKNSDKVVFGEDDWLFLRKGSRPDIKNPIPILNDLCGIAPFGKRQLREWVETLKNNHNQLEARNIDYLFVIVPNKHSIYTSNLPGYARCENETTRLDQLVDALSSEPGFPLLDIRNKFRALANSGEKLYYKTDTHWNGNGMIAAYDLIYTHLKNKHNVRNAKIEGQAFVPEGPRSGGDLANLLGIAADISEHNHGLQLAHSRSQVIGYPFDEHMKDPNRRPSTWRFPDDSLADAFIVHDSFFGTAIGWLFVESFRETTFFWRSFPYLEFEFIDKVQPNIVIHQMVERTLLQPYFVEED